jgi:phage I-like protein
MEKKLSIGDVQTLVSASFTSAIPKSAPGEIVYIPVGSSTITPSVNGKPQKVTVNVPAEKGNEIAARMQKALERRLAGSVRPRLAFDHAATGPAAGHPKGFSFDPARGLILSLDWSNSGRSAIEGGDYGYFSPSFLMGENGEPVGLSDIGEIGSLVDEPAFRSIGLIAANDLSYLGAMHTPRMWGVHQGKPDKYLHQTENQNDMNLIHAALGVDSASAGADNLAVQRITDLKAKADRVDTVEASLKTVETDRDGYKAKLEAAEKTIKEGQEKRADDLVKAAVTAGKILPKDEETQSFYRELIAAGNAAAEKALEKLPELNGDLDQPIVKAGQDKNTPAGEHKFVTAAKAKVASKEADNIDAAFAIVAAENPALYGEYREEALVAIQLA